MASTDRTSFFAEQDRRRAQAWRLSALSFGLLLIAGLPLAMLVTPLLVAVLVIVGRAWDLWLPVPAEVWAGLHALITADRSGGRSLVAGLVRLSALLVPGLALIAFVWWRLRRGLERAGAGWMVRMLGGRPPRPAEFEEAQIGNLVQEMGLAAGVDPPEVFIVDEDAPNAAVVGPTDASAAFIVTRGLLDRFGRDETQAIIGYLMAGARQGNLQSATAVHTAFHALGFVLLAFDACFNLSRKSWRDLRRVMGWLAAPDDSSQEASDVFALLERIEPHDDGLTGLQADLVSDGPPKTRLGALLRRVPVLYVAILPLLLVYIVFMFVRLELFLLRALVIGPVLVLAWRQRVHLADAAAVQLTRHPQGLADAITLFQAQETVGLAAPWLAAYCFIGSTATTSQAGSGAPPGGLPPHPASRNRLRRIGAMGATIDAEPRRRWRFPTLAEVRRSGPWLVLFVPLVLLVAYLLLFLIGMVFGLAALFSLLFLLLVLTAIGALLP